MYVSPIFLCQASSKKHDPFLDLSIDIPQVIFGLSYNIMANMVVCINNVEFSSDIHWSCPKIQGQWKTTKLPHPWLLAGKAILETFMCSHLLSSEICWEGGVGGLWAVLLQQLQVKATKHQAVPNQAPSNCPLPTYKTLQASL